MSFQSLVLLPWIGFFVMTVFSLGVFLVLTLAQMATDNQPNWQDIADDVEEEVDA